MTDKEKTVIEAARAVRMARSGEARGIALLALYEAIDALDGVKAVDDR